MRIQSMERKFIISISLIMIILCMFCLTSCMNSMQKFMDKDPEYDYLVFEFSKTSYAWVDYCNIKGYGEWTFGEKTIPILMDALGGSFLIDLYSCESHLEPGKIYQDKESEEIFRQSHTYKKHIMDISFYNAKIDWQNKNAIVSPKAETEGVGFQEGMLEEDSKTITIRKLSSEEWREWMKEHSLDPDLYVPQ